MNIGLIIQISNKQRNENHKFKCENIEQVKTILITHLYLLFIKNNIDINNKNECINFFTFYIYSKEWITPWTNEEIYYEILNDLNSSEIIEPLRRTDSISDHFFL